VGRELPFVQDTAVDPKFGTGVVKVTPAHDLADFDMGQRHNLEQISVIGEDAKITPAGGVYHGMDRFDARKKIVEDLEAQGLLVKVESLANSVGRCDRCSTIVEPLLSTQWFVKIKPLADRRLKPWSRGRQSSFRRMGEYLFRVDAQHPRLVHFAAALVGTSHSGVVLLLR
jgi:valyl-tRNA synthetase